MEEKFVKNGSIGNNLDRHRKKTKRLSVPEDTEIGLRVMDMPVFVSRKFEKVILYLIKFIEENAHFAFL